MSSPQEGTVGAVIQYTVLDGAGAPLNISTATTKKLIFKKPNGAVIEKTAEFVTDGIDGKLKYVTVANDLVPSGTWRAQAYVVVPGVADGKTEVKNFPVSRNL